jgi:hypothetical protein
LAYWNGVDDIDGYEEGVVLVPHWSIILGQSYATGVWQLHDHTAQNGTFKSNLYAEKTAFVERKRAAGLPGDIEKQEIVLVVSRAIQKSFANRSYAVKALAETGWCPPTMAPLDDPSILQSAPDDVKKARTELIAKRGGSLISDNSNALIMPSERDLMGEGSGLMAGHEAVARAAQELNYSGGTAANLFKLSSTVASRDAGRRRHMNEIEEEGEPDLDTLKKRYSEMSRLTANNVVSKGTGVLGIALFDETMKRAKAREEEKEAQIASKREANKESLQAEVAKVNKKLAEYGGDETRLNVKELKTLIKSRKKKGDPAIPSDRASVLTRFRQYFRSDVNAQQDTADTDQSEGEQDTAEKDDSEVEHNSSSDSEDGSSSEDDESICEFLQT